MATNGDTLGQLRAKATNVWELLRSDPSLRQGPHADPATAPAPATSSPEAQAARDSSVFPAFRSSVEAAGVAGAREAVLQELETYYKRSRDETLERCINWEDYSVAEWQQGDRSTAEGLLDFYQQCESWAYDLLWYDLLRLEGYAEPTAAMIGDWLRRHGASGALLDFGSGVGTTGMMFAQLGWSVTLGDISMPLLDFACWRAERHGVALERLDLRTSFPTAAFNVITAIDAFAHVPDPADTARSFYEALLPGGYLFADFDTRPPTEFNAWHLYDTPHHLKRAIIDAGFVEVDRIAGGVIHVYRRRDVSVPVSGRDKAMTAWQLGRHQVAATRTRWWLITQARRAVSRLP